MTQQAQAACRVRVYINERANCCLCDEVLEHLTPLRARYDFLLDTVGVHGDPQLAARHGERVPVVEVNGREIGWGRIPPAILEAHIAAATRQHDATA